MSGESIYDILWVEKYRPKKLDEIVNQTEVVQRLKRFVEERNMPHLLFAGPPGTGKTTAAHALARELFGDEYRRYLLELNASVAKDTPILVRINGKIIRTDFEYLDKLYFRGEGVLSFKDGEYVKPGDLEVLTYDPGEGRVTWKKATWLIRHRVEKVLEVRVSGGGKIRLTGNHSVMVIGENGELVEKSASDLRPGDYLVSFVDVLPGDETEIPMEYKLVSSRVLGFRKTNRELETSGQLVITLGYPRESKLVEKLVGGASTYELPVYSNVGYSGFDRSRASSYQVRILSTGLARFLRKTAYMGEARARDKRVPGILFAAPPKQRIAFLRGLFDGYGSGVWGSVARISSVPGDLLVDIAWLARISGIESSVHDSEARLIWKGGVRYKKSDLLPARPFIRFLEKVSHAVKGNWRYILRHQLYDGKERVSKEKVLEALYHVDMERLSSKDRAWLEKLIRLAKSGLHVVKVVSVEIIEYNDYVYDVSVPGNNMFFAGTIPILLHNSDERGIDVIRTKVKEFARAKNPSGVAFKIVLLDEADNMTSDAQQALRRLMELYTVTTRFILIANYPSKIIPPIQSRCAYFRFTPLSKEDVVARLAYILERESVEYEVDALEAIYEISEGDMRKAINILQAASALGKVSVSAVYKVVGLAHPSEVKEMIELALKGEFLEARARLRKLMIEYGLAGSDLLKQIHSELFGPRIKLPEEYVVLIADYLGEIHFRVVEGSDDDIQLTAFLAWLSMLGKKMGEA